MKSGKSDFERLEDICAADPRNKYFEIIDSRTGEQRPFKLEDLHSGLDSIKLNEAVPSAIHDHFNIGRNACLYGWFVYEFSMLALHQGYISVEFALKEKFKRQPEYKPKGWGLESYLSRAINLGWIVDGGFSSIRIKGRQRNPTWQVLDYEPKEYDETGTEYSKGPLIKSMTSLRNSLAHGSPMLFEPSAVVAELRLCSEVINQLFPDD